MKKISTAAAKQTRNFQDQKLTMGLDLGDCTSWYCVLNGAGEVVLEQKLSTTPKAMKEVCSGGCHGVGSHWRRGCIRRGSAGY
jgi:transposase